MTRILPPSSLKGKGPHCFIKKKSFTFSLWLTRAFIIFVWLKVGFCGVRKCHQQQTLPASLQSKQTYKWILQFLGTVRILNISKTWYVCLAPGTCQTVLKEKNSKTPKSGIVVMGDGGGYRMECGLIIVTRTYDETLLWQQEHEVALGHQWKGEKWEHKYNWGVSINQDERNERGLDNIQKVDNLLLVILKE